MDITPLDITILVASTIGIILMSFAFPALGLTGDEAQESEVPEFDVETSRFDLAGDFPTRPSSPGGGTLVQSTERGDPDKWLTGGTSDGEFVFLVNNGNDSDPQWEVGVQDWDNDAVTNEANATITEGQQVSIEEGDWIVSFRLDRVYYTDGGAVVGEATYDVEEDGQSDDSAWYSGIPIVSETADGIIWVGRTIAFLGNVMLWGVLTLTEFGWNMAFAIFDMATFAFDLSDFLVGTYSDVTTADGLASWAQVILLIPGILFMVEWMKLTAVFVNMVWIG